MKKLFIITIALTLFAISATPTYAHSGCCSSHGGVSGCGCADGTPLSQTCAPYYPECSGGAPKTAPIYTAPKTYSPAPKKVVKIYPTTKPTVAPKPKKKVVKKKVTKKAVHKKPVKPTPTSHKKKN